MEKKYKDNYASSNIDDTVRSEKVKKFLGEQPPVVLRWGTLIVIIVVLVGALLVLPLEFPHSDGETIWHHLISSIFSNIL